MGLFVSVDLRNRQLVRTCPLVGGWLAKDGDSKFRERSRNVNRLSRFAAQNQTKLTDALADLECHRADADGTRQSPVFWLKALSLFWTQTF
jgi:hypothetical protein